MFSRLGLLAAILAASCAQLRAASGPPLPLRLRAQFTTDPLITQGNIMTEVMSKKAGLSACFEAEKAASGGHGKLLLVWDILPTGEIANIGVADPDYASREISHCVARVMAACRFSASAKGATNIVFPFKF
jgi:hypothetical protein